jgi:tripartite-type tricarboxylate transporter receptor subunit TctC
MLAPALHRLARGIGHALLAAPLALTSLQAIAEDACPNRPVKIIAPQAPGGRVDLVARIIAERLARALGATFIVENQAGAGGAIAAQATSRARSPSAAR